MTSNPYTNDKSGDNPTKGMPAPDHTVIIDAPRELGCYRLTQILGRGGMGEVWQAFDTQLERDVAIKLMRKELLSNEDATRRFAREARAVARLNHPNIVHVYAFGDEKGLTYFIMEMVEGETVAQRLKRNGKLPLNESLAITMQAVEGLSYANARGIIHRDIKPSNLMLTEEARVKIADFGLAKMVEHDTQMTAAGTAMGSPNYMSPEQARGEEADHRSDIYALGISLYQMLCNCLPFTANSPVSVLLKQIQEPLPNPEELKILCNGDVMAVLIKMTEKVPEKRYQSYGELATALAALQPELLHKGAHNITASMPIANTPPPAAFDLANSIEENSSIGLSKAMSPPTPPAPDLPSTPSDFGTAVISSRDLNSSSSTSQSSTKKNRWLISAFAALAILAVAASAAWYFSLKIRDSGINFRVNGPAGIAALNETSPAPVQTPVPSPTRAAITTSAATAPNDGMQPINITAIVTPRPTPYPGVPTIVTPLPNPADLVPSSGRLALNNPSNPSEAIVLVDATGNPIGSLPAGTIASLIRPATLNGSKWYIIRHNNSEAYIPITHAQPASPADVPPQAATANTDPNLYILGTQGAGPNEQVPTYLDDKGRNSYKSFPSGSQVTYISSTPTMIRANAPDGRPVYIHKKMVSQKP